MFLLMITSKRIHKDVKIDFFKENSLEAKDLMKWELIK